MHEYAPRRGALAGVCDLAFSVLAVVFGSALSIATARHLLVPPGPEIRRLPAPNVAAMTVSARVTAGAAAIRPTARVVTVPQRLDSRPVPGATRVTAATHVATVRTVPARPFAAFRSARPVRASRPFARQGLSRAPRSELPTVGRSHSFAARALPPTSRGARRQRVSTAGPRSLPRRRPHAAARLLIPQRHVARQPAGGRPGRPVRAGSRRAASPMVGMRRRSRGPSQRADLLEPPLGYDARPPLLVVPAAAEVDPAGEMPALPVIRPHVRR